MTIRCVKDKDRRDRLFALWENVKREAVPWLRATGRFRASPPPTTDPPIGLEAVSVSTVVPMVEFLVRSGMERVTRRPVWVVEAVDGKAPALVVSGPHGGRGP